MNKADKSKTKDNIENNTHTKDIVDKASLESFPASDPPPWTKGVDKKD